MSSDAGRNQKEAFVTLATNDSYALGALVLSRSLKRVHTTRKLVVMVTNQVTQSMRDTLHTAFDEISDVDIIDSLDTKKLELLQRPDLGLTFTKLHCWLLENYEKCVFLDADTLILKNIDELFDREELSAAPDAGWPDCFNSGVFVFRPSRSTYNRIHAFALEHGSFDGGDQGLLNLYFKDWASTDPSRRLPFTYNVVSQAFYSYLPAFIKFNSDIKVVHFIGRVKPWHHFYNKDTRQVEIQFDPGHDASYLQMWWDIFTEDIEPNLSLDKSSITGSRPVGGAARGGSAYSCEIDRQYSWEKGQVDYMGVDSFSNIKDKLEHTLKSAHPQ